MIFLPLLLKSVYSQDEIISHKFLKQYIGINILLSCSKSITFYSINKSINKSTILNNFIESNKFIIDVLCYILSHIIIYEICWNIIKSDQFNLIGKEFNKTYSSGNFLVYMFSKEKKNINEFNWLYRLLISLIEKSFLNIPSI